MDSKKEVWSKILSTIKTVKNWLYEADGIWSIPVAIATFVLFGYVVQWFDITAGTYDISFFQPILLTGAIVIATFGFITLGLFFNFPFLYDYFFKGKKEESQISFDWKHLTSIQRILVAFGAVGGLFVIFIFIYSKLV